MLAQLLRRTAALYSGMKTMRATFGLVTTNSLLHTTVSSRGTLFQRRPDRILLRFDDPKGDVVLGDGRFSGCTIPAWMRGR